MKKKGIFSVLFVFFLFSALVAIFLWPSQKAAVQPAAHQVLLKQAPEQYTIEAALGYRVRLENATPRQLGSARGMIYLPVTEHHKQWLREVEVAGLGEDEYRIVADGSGNRMLYFKLPNFAVGAVRELTVKTELLLSDGAEEQNEERHIYSRFGPEHLALLDAAGLEEIEFNLDAPGELMRSLLASVRQSLSTSSKSGGVDAPTLDPDLYLGRLVVALARKHEVPARLLVGLDLGEPERNQSYSFRTAVEYLDGGRWRIVSLVADGEEAGSSDRFIALRMLDNETTGLNGAALKDLVAEGGGLHIRFH